MVVMVVIMALTGPAAAGVVFGVDNFNGGVLSNWSSGSFTLGVDTTPSGQNFLGIGGDSSNFGLTNGSVTLTVPTAAAHTSATALFRLYVIRSMDGDEPFSVSGDGTDLINPDALFSNLGTSTCTDNVSAGCTNIKAVIAPAGTVGPVVAALGFTPLNCCAVGDTYYDLTLTFPHSAASLALVFSYGGLQDLNDESWGLDNVAVQTNASITEPPPSGVPAPATLWLLCLGVVGLAVATRNLRSPRDSSQS
ncbi:MAG: PEP-CTERM sorting domain-containing protein [Candidatus Rokubacteria bacterium]|nr:PEP-CTERM sorting domain-containing protein [Candidatus Rokubacteria bacterium]